MKESTRLAATLIIWIALAAVIGSTLSSPTGAIARANSGTIFGVVAILAITAMVSTAAVWMGGWRTTLAQQDTAHLARGKHKRAGQSRLGQDRLARLIAELDDEDVYDLEALLLARDRDSDQAQQQR